MKIVKVSRDTKYWCCNYNDWIYAFTFSINWMTLICHVFYFTEDNKIVDRKYIVGLSGKVRKTITIKSIKKMCDMINQTNWSYSANTYSQDTNLPKQFRKILTEFGKI